ncbi:MAG: nicotinate-nucleotide diphosphorylase (carboxylating) [Candidatus Cloacimonadota bacterium]|nr:MAG: nicotinate-nucleotide diphosphorylase (carboxylating) [Candidatus Cloacimonadota bacterium]
MNISEIVALGLKEDLGHGDISTEYLELGVKQVSAFLIAKEDGIIAGLETVREVFRQVDPQINIIAYCKDGDAVKKGEEIIKIKGNASSILKGERVALNFLQRMSGIASATNRLVKAVSGTKAKILDTRKTTPGLRFLEKYSVKTGGGFNHRFGLFDMIMLKENHIRAAGSITKATELIKKNNTTYKIEAEVTNSEELDEAVRAKVDRVMLDNMSIQEMKKAVEKYGGIVELEASGNVTLEKIREIAETGVDYISSGALTHSCKSMDISLLFKE